MRKKDGEGESHICTTISLFAKLGSRFAIVRLICCPVGTKCGSMYALPAPHCIYGGCALWELVKYDSEMHLARRPKALHEVYTIRLAGPPEFPCALQ